MESTTWPSILQQAQQCQHYSSLLQDRVQVLARSRHFVRGKFPQRGFCTSSSRIWGSILGCKFLSPEFWGRSLGSNLLALCFPIKRAPSRIHPQEIHRSKFTPNSSTQNPDWKIHIPLLQGHFADILHALRHFSGLYTTIAHLCYKFSWFLLCQNSWTCAWLPVKKRLFTKCGVPQIGA